MFNLKIESNDVMFKIVTSEDEIMFIDEDGGSLKWDNNKTNKVSIEQMVEQITGEYFKL